MYQNIYPYQSSMTRRDGKASKTQAALGLFRRMNLSGELTKFFAGLVGRSTELRDLEKVESQAAIRSRFDAGIQTVSIRQITGSQGRSHDFDRNFNPLNDHTRDRWLNIALARRKGIGLPPVELVKVGDEYFVRDGHHRISVARAYGESYIDAHVTVWKVSPPAGTQANPKQTAAEPRTA